VPEPEIYAMMAAGLGMMGFMSRRRKQKQAQAAA
jgi:PEP-CTERM motif